MNRLGRSVESPTTAVPWRARSYRPGDEKLLASLFEEVFHRPMSEDHWRWKLKTLPSPVENVAVAVDPDDRPVFQLAGIPCRYQLAGRDATVMVAVDAMTAPMYRRQGILKQLGRELFESWRASGVSMAIGLPNEQYNKAVLGWQPLFSLKWLIRPLQPERILARRLKLRGLARLGVAGRWWNWLWDRRESRASRVRIRDVRAADAEIDLLWSSCRHSVTTSVVRDSSWVNWRYLAAPYRRYRVVLAEQEGQPVGYAAYYLNRSTNATWGVVADLFTAPNNFVVMEALVAEIVRRMRVEGADAVATLAVPRTGAYRTYRRAGFLFSKGSFSVECALLDRSLSLDALRAPQSWCLAGGDFDVV